MRAEFSKDSGYAALWQKRPSLPRQAGKEAFHIYSEARAGLGQVEHSQAPYGVCVQSAFLLGQGEVVAFSC